MQQERPSGSGILDRLIANAARAGRSPALRRRFPNRWEPVTFEQFHDEVRQVAKGLAASGVQPGDRVAVMSAARYEWTLVDYAIWYAGAVGVPLFETSSDEQVEWILSDSGAVAAFVDSAANRAVLDRVAGALPNVRSVWVFDDDGVADLQQCGELVGDDDLDLRRGSLMPDSIATIIYTCGTTGRPKGCVLTHRNLLAGVTSICEALPGLFTPAVSALLLVPPAHVFGRAAQAACIHAGVPFGFGTAADLAAFAPTFVVAVPSVLDAVIGNAAASLEASREARLWRAAAATAVAYSESLDRGGPSPVLRVQHALLDRTVYAGLRRAMGGRLRYAVSGGAPLNPQVAHMLRGSGVTVLEGYGLTETSAAATANRPTAARIGSVGRPLPGVGVRIAADGEILLHGEAVFAGYWNDQQATQRALTPDGWLRTGDIGNLDRDGFLRITGRKKEVIITAGGKNVAPAALEDRVRAHRLVSQCMVVGDDRPYVAALITIDPMSLGDWLVARNRPRSTDARELTDDPELLAEIATAVDAANRSVSRAESIRRFAVLADEWTPAGGQLTATMKLRRDVLSQQCRNDVEALYA